MVDPPLRILVTDDSADHLAILAATLDAPDHDLLVAQSGASALRIAEATPPDLVLLDVRMPGIDGYETCRRLRAMPGLADVPVIFVSGLDHADDRATAFRAGGSDYLVKPYAHEELRGRVHAHLVGARLRRQLAEFRAAEIRMDRPGLDAAAAVLVGPSALAQGLREAVAQHLTTSRLVIRGGLTEGVVSLARALHRGSVAPGPLVIVGPGASLSSLPSGPACVLVQHAPRQPADAWTHVTASRLLLHAQEPGPLPSTDAEIELPPLRDRDADVPAIVAHVAARDSARLCRVPLSAARLETLARASWPGGLAHLTAAVRAAVLESAPQ
jgi:DNA-binding NtrC family response regulator